MSARDAEAKGVAIDTHEVPLAQVNRAVTDGEEEGFVRVHATRGSGRRRRADGAALHGGNLAIPEASPRMKVRAHWLRKMPSFGSSCTTIDRSRSTPPRAKLWPRKSHA